MPKRRLHPLEKPFFLESASQKWAAIFVGLGAALAAVQGKGWISDVTPFLNYFVIVAVVFLGGSHAIDAMRVLKSGQRPINDPPEPDNHPPRP